jgi:hypothetical protein
MKTFYEALYMLTIVFIAATLSIVIAAMRMGL